MVNELYYYCLTNTRFCSSFLHVHTFCQVKESATAAKLERKKETERSHRKRLYIRTLQYNNEVRLFVYVCIYDLDQCVAECGSTS